MSFGRNPYVPKAQAAELKAEEASDDASWARAYHEAAHEWDRAAKREKPGKLRDEYERNATHAREMADSPRGGHEEPDEPQEADDASSQAAASEPDAPRDADDASAGEGVVVGIFSATRARRGPED